MAQRDVIKTLGSIVKRWEQNKRQVLENKGLTLPGNKAECEDFDVFDQWLGRQRKFIRDYIAAEDHEDLKTCKKFLKLESDVPQIHLHFSVWSSLVNTDSKVILERFSRLLNEYHQSRVTTLSNGRRCPVNEYKNQLAKEMSIIRQIARAKESYHFQVEATNKVKYRDIGQWEADYETMVQRKQIHQTKMARKTYEDILRYESGIVRSALFKVSNELEELIVREEEKRLTQLLAILDEYFKLLLYSTDLEASRRTAISQMAKLTRTVSKKIPVMVKTWIQNHRISVEFPEFQMLDEADDSVTYTHLLVTIGDEINAIENRLKKDVYNEEVICLSSSDENQSQCTRTHHAEYNHEALFKTSSDCQAKRSHEASDLSVEDLDGGESGHVLYPTQTSSARTFKLFNQRRRNSTQSINSLSSSSRGCMDIVPGTLISEEKITTPVRRTRQLSFSSSDDEYIEIENNTASAKKCSSDEVQEFRPSENGKKNAKLLGQLTGIYVKAKTDYFPTRNGDLAYDSGDLIKQQKPADINGMAYGYLRKSKFATKQYGYYSIKNMRFCRYGSKVQRSSQEENINHVGDKTNAATCDPKLI